MSTNLVIKWLNSTRSKEQTKLVEEQLAKKVTSSFETAAKAKDVYEEACRFRVPGNTWDKTLDIAIAGIEGNLMGPTEKRSARFICTFL